MVGLHISQLERQPPVQETSVLQMYSNTCIWGVMASSGAPMGGAGGAVMAAKTPRCRGEKVAGRPRGGCGDGTSRPPGSIRVTGNLHPQPGSPLRGGGWTGGVGTNRGTRLHR